MVVPATCRLFSIVWIVAGSARNSAPDRLPSRYVVADSVVPVAEYGAPAIGAVPPL